MDAHDLNTSTQDLKARIDDLNRMILDNQILEAIDKHYAEEVVMQENEDAPTVGRAANREREETFLANVTEFRNAEVRSVAVDAERGVTMVEWFYDYTHAEWGDRTYYQVSRQQWKDGKIIHERFYYGS